MTPTIRITSIIISCSLSDKFSPSSASEFLGEILTRTVLPIRDDGRVTPSVTCYTRLSWRSPGPGAQKPGPRLAQHQPGLAGLDTEWAQSEMRWPLERQQGRSQTVAIPASKKQEPSDPNLIFQWHSSDVENVKFFVRLFRDALFDWIYKILVAKIVR